MRARLEQIRGPIEGALASLVGAAATAYDGPPPQRSWPLRTSGRRSGRPRDLVWLADVAFAIVVVAVTAAAFNGGNDALGRPFGPGLTFLAGVAAGVPLAFRDRSPSSCGGSPLPLRWSPRCSWRLCSSPSRCIRRMPWPWS